MGLTGGRIVVTGAASGIGAATAELLLAAGAHVVSLDRRRPAAAVEHVDVDLADPQSIDAAVAAVLAEGAVDGLCNVAGVPGTVPGELVMRVNFLGLRHLTERLGAAMDAGACVINVASFAGEQWREREPLHRELIATGGFDAGLRWLAEHPVPEELAYPLSKEVLRVWTKTLAGAWIGRGIRVNAVSPGPVETPILDEFRSSLGIERVQADIDFVGRAGTVDDVAPVVAWLCSDAARWVNGADIAADGGLAAAAAADARGERAT